MSLTVPRAPRRNRQFWMDHVNDWKNSDLSKAAYCQLHSLNSGSFYNWSRPARSVNEGNGNTGQQRELAPLPDKSLSFVPVRVKPAERRMEVRLVHVERAATRVALPTDLSPEQIQHWLFAIHQLHV